MTTTPPHQETAPDANHPATNRTRRKLAWVLAVPTLAIAALVITLLALWHAEPGYWKQRALYMQAHSDQQLHDIAKSVEDKLTAAIDPPDLLPEEPPRPHDPPEPAGRVAEDDYLITSLMPDESLSTTEPEATEPVASPEASILAITPGQPLPQRVRLTMNEVNTWMNQRLDDWLHTQGKRLPKGIKEPMLAREGNRFVLAFKYDTPQLKQVVSLKFHLRMELDGSASVQLEDVRGGRLKLPTKGLNGAVLQQAQQFNQSASRASRKLQKLIDYFDGMRLDPVIDVNSNKVRITELNLDEQGLDMALKSAPGL